MSYTAPVKEFEFLLTAHLQESQLSTTWPPDTVATIVAQAAQFADNELAPLNAIGDRHGVQWHDGEVMVTPQFKQAYQRFCEQGWPALRAPVDRNGMAAPQTIAAAIEEMWCAANLAFRLAPMLSRSAVEAIHLRGNAFLKEVVLPRLISGEWLGTMNLTEPQAGSDVGAVRTKATKRGERYFLKGQKCFITYGEHDLTANIVHLILARIEGAPAGTKGLSLFLVPKYRLDDAGQPQQRNDVRSLGVERKLGIHASPTCVMSYGESPDSGGAEGYLVGAEGEGMEIMFIMMNNARLAVGIEGHALAERALQMATQYAKTRVQGRVPDRSDSLAIESHPDVRRMLWEMQARVQAARALSFYTASLWDNRDANSGARLALLIPLVKLLGTETGQNVTSMSLQVHGGMGYIEDTGIAQLYRDARIGAIYEGTNGIQALDFLMRKVAKDDGIVLLTWLAELAEDVQILTTEPWICDMAPRLTAALEALIASTQAQLGRLKPQTTSVTDATISSGLLCAQALATPFALQAALTIAGWCLCRQLRFTNSMDATFWNSKRRAIETYLLHVLPETLTLADRIKSGGFGYNSETV